MVMLNVLYFKGLWEGINAFDPTETRYENFRKLDGTRTAVPMMIRKRMVASYTHHKPRSQCRHSCQILGLLFQVCHVDTFFLRDKYRLEQKTF